MPLVIENNKGIRETTNEIFDVYLDQVIEFSGGMISIAKYFAVIGVVIKLVVTYMNPSQRTNIWSYTSWVVLAFFLLNYTSFIKGIFYIYELIGKALRSSTIDWDTAYSHLEFSAEKVTDTSFFSAETVDKIYQKGLIDTIYQSVKIKYMSIVIIITVVLVKIVSTVVFIFVKAYAVIYLMILVVFGPINIGLSFIPALDGMWKGWLQKLLNVSMWIPMLYLIDAFMLGLINQLFNSLIKNDIDVTKVLGASLLSGMSIFMYIKAPSLSNFIVQGSGVGKLSMGGQSKNAANKVARGVKTLAKMKTGGISGAIAK